jgi:hypothetical protein
VFGTRQAKGPLTIICFCNLERNPAIRVSVTTLKATADLLGTDVRSLTTTVNQNQAASTNQVAALANQVAASTNQVAALANQVAALANQVAALTNLSAAVFGGSLVFLAIGLISSSMATRKR